MGCLENDQGWGGFYGPNGVLWKMLYLVSQKYHFILKAVIDCFPPKASPSVAIFFRSYRIATE